MAHLRHIQGIKHFSECLTVPHPISVTIAVIGAMLQPHETPISDATLWRAPQPGPPPDSRRSPENSSGEAVRQVQARLTTRRLDELKPHPAYARLGIQVPSFKLNALIEQGEYAFSGHLEITTEGLIIDGYARWEVARRQCRPSLQCIEYELSEWESLHRLLLSHVPSPGLVPFDRIVLALGLESHFRQKARLNQQAGGKNKGSSKLTEAQRLDVCKEIAAAACVSVGSLSHVKQLLRTADPTILQALHDGQIRIDRAWRWSKQPRDVQRENLKAFLRQRGMDKTAERLVAGQLRRQKSQPLVKNRWKNPSSDAAMKCLASLPPDVLSSVNVILVRAPGRLIALSHDLAQEIGLGEEPTTCG